MPVVRNFEMYKYTKFYQNIPCGSRVISVFANCSLTGFGRTHTPVIVQTDGLCNTANAVSTLCYENFLQLYIELETRTTVTVNHPAYFII